MALQKVSPGLLPAENYNRFGRAFDAVDANAAAVAQALQALGGKQDAFDLAALLSTIAGLATKAALANEALLRGLADSGEIQARQNAVADLLARIARINAGLYPAERPGDNPTAFTASPAGGDPDALAPLDTTVYPTRTVPDGLGVEISGSREVWERTLHAVETGRLWDARWRLTRTVNAQDPDGDAVTRMIAWYGPARNLLSIVNIASDTPLVGDPPYERTNLVGDAGAAGVTVARPAGAVYYRLGLKAYGIEGRVVLTDLGATDISALRDAILALVPSDSLPALSARIDAEIQRAEGAEGALDGRLTPIERVSRVLDQLTGTEFDFLPLEAGAGKGLLVVDPDTSKVIARIAGEAISAAALRLLTGGGLMPGLAQTGLAVEFGNPGLNRSGIGLDGGLEVLRLLIGKSLTALRDAGVPQVSVKDPAGRLAPLLDVVGRLAGDLPAERLVHVRSDGTSIPVRPLPHIACWADSQGQGIEPGAKAWPEYLQDLFAASGDTRRVVNCGAGGQNSAQIMGRMGAIPVAVTLDGNAITYGQDTLVTAMAPRILTPGWDRVATTTLAGVRGLFFRSGVDPQGNDAIYFRPDPGPGRSGTVPCPPGTTFVVDAPYAGWINILATGQNDVGKDPKVWRDNTLAGIRSLKVGDPRTFVLGTSLFADSLPDGAPPDRSTGRPPQYPGTDGWRATTDLNAEMARLCPGRFLDVHRYLVDYGLRDALAYGLISGITAGDRQDQVNDFVPRNIRYDELHYGTKAHQLIAIQQYNIIVGAGL